MRRRWLATLAGAMAAAGLAQAQLAGGLRGGGPPISRDEPVYYQSDSAEYDRDGGLVTLTGHVEIWQGERLLRADRVTYDRNTKVAAAQGHVVLVEADGQTVFSDYAELSDGLKNGILRDPSARLAENGTLVANGGRRTAGKINELSRAVYTTCNLCAQHPERRPLWDIRARSVLQDGETKQIEYRDAVVDIYGIPVAYFPYLSHADPSVKRASGFLVPSIGQSTHLGAYAAVPYYWVIDGQSDATITPVITTQTGPALEGQYRRRFNSGELDLRGSVAYDQEATQGHVFGTGKFAIDDEWRWGFDINRASSDKYLRDFRIAQDADVLTSSVFLEGFGQGAYSRLDTRVYQGLTDAVVAARLPYVVPHYQYSFQGAPDRWGGRLDVEADTFNIIRDQGANTARAALGLTWNRPFTDPVGGRWIATLHGDAAAYSVRQLDAQPSYGPRNTAQSAQALPSASVLWRWPLVRDSSLFGADGTQTIEPIAQLILAPRSSRYALARRANGTQYVNSLIPNEDSLDTDFTDTTLFALNRHQGFDRLEGAPRATVALHGNWQIGTGNIDAQIGQSYRMQRDASFLIGSGLENRVSDYVSHVTISPDPVFDLTTQQRFDRRNFRLHLADALASAGTPTFRLAAGYLYSDTNPFNYYDAPPTGVLPKLQRNEILLSGNGIIGPWKVGAFVRRDLASGKMVAVGGSTSYEDECLGFDVNLFKRYTSLNGDRGATTVLFQLTFKTVGTFGFHAI